MTASALSKYKRCYTLLSPHNLSQFQWFPYRQKLSSARSGCSSSHRKMISMRRGLWGKVSPSLSRPNQTIPRANLQNFYDPSAAIVTSTVSSSAGTTDEPMPAAEGTTSPQSSKRARLDVDMPTNTAMMPPVLRFAKLSEHAKAPKKGTDFAAGYDLHSAQVCVIPAQGKGTVMTDIQIELPEDCYGRIAPRSGLARKNHIDVGAGVIDRDYRGNVGVVMFNHSKEDFQVEKGDRIAQLICERIFYPDLQEVKELSKTERGSAGYGSTGTK